VKISSGRHGQQHTIEQIGLREQPLVPLGISTAALGPLIEILQLDVKNRRLQGIQPAIDAHRFVQIPHATPMHSQHRERIGYGGIIGCHQTAIAKPTEIFGREKTETAHVG
jgi:hypothetical protein